MSVVGGYIELAAMSESEACGKALNGAAICFGEEQQSEIGRWLFAADRMPAAIQAQRRTEGDSPALTLRVRPADRPKVAVSPLNLLDLSMARLALSPRGRNLSARFTLPPSCHGFVL
jgi:hypothetical protein